MADQAIQNERLKQALSELRANRAVFSTQAYGHIVMLLLNELRRANTLPPTLALPGDEMRLVTVMFLDIIDSTQMALQVDAGDLKTIIGEAHARAATLIQQWDGEIGQYLGDGLLCFFGTRRSRGDDALRAVSCAMALQTSLEQYANQVFLDHGVEFAARVGISTGRVVVAVNQSSDKARQMAMGPAINLAARLQTLAAPGGIVIDATTWNRVRHHFQIQARPPVELKGFEQPVQYYAVTGRVAHSARELTTTRVNGLPLHFAGREVELSRLRHLLEEARIQRRCHAVTIVGETGIGKSRLLQEILAESETLALTPLVMVAAYEQRNTSFNLLRDMLMTVCELNEDTTPGDARERIREYVTGTWDDPNAQTAAAAMGYLTGFDTEANPLIQPLRQGEKDRATSALISMVVRWFRVIAERGLLLVVDNLQWADSASVWLLDAIVHEVMNTPLVLIAAARPMYRSVHPMYLQNMPAHTLISPGPLSPEATGEVLDRVLSQIERIPETLRQIIMERAEGNPLFIQEFLEMMFDQGVFVRHNRGNWRFNIIRYDTALTALPQGLIGVLQARLDDLTPEARQIVQIAAVVGQIFWHGAVAEVTDINPHPLLETLIRRGMIVAHEDTAFTGEREYAFRHSLYRDVAYEGIPRARREAYHRQVARWLVTRIAEKPEFYNILAEQFEAASEHETALYTWLEAVQNRLNRGLLTEALALNDRGLALARSVTREVALPVVTQLWMLRGQALNALGRFEEASAASQSALRLLGEMPADTGRKTRAGAAQILAKAFSSLGRYEEAYQALAQAKEFIDTGDSFEEAAILRAFGALNFYRGRLEESMVYLQRAYELTRDSGAASLSGTMTYLGRVALESGDPATALMYMERVLETNYERGYRHYQVLDLRNIGLIYMTLLCFDRAMVAFDEALTIQEGAGLDDNSLKAYRALCLMYMGQVNTGLPLLTGAATRGERDTFQAYVLQLKFIRGLALAGDIVKAHATAVALAEQVKSRNPVIYGRALLEQGKASHSLGDPGALALLKEGLQYEEQYAGRDLWLFYEALAAVVPGEEMRRNYLRQAAQALRHTGNTLSIRPDLQYAFLNNPRVKRILHEAEN